MKLPKLPAECIRRALVPSPTHISKTGIVLQPDTLAAGLLLGEFDTNLYSTEELLKLKVLEPIMQVIAYVYAKAGLDEELIQFFDSIKNSSPAVIYFVRGIRAADDRPLNKSKVKQHILDTLIGTAWRDSNFRIWGRPEALFCKGTSTLSHDIKWMITKHFEAKYNRDPSIETLLSKGLCIFNELPQDRLAKFFDALRRLMPYIRYLHMPTEYRKQHQFLVDDKHTGNLYIYDLAHFPITFSVGNMHYTNDMQARWTILDKELVINKTFELQFYKEVEKRHIDKFITEFYNKYPQQARASTIERDHECRIRWKNTESYPLPEDLQELGKIWRELL